MGASPLSLWREMEASSKRRSLLSSWLQSGEQSCAVGFQLPAEIIPAPLAVPNLLSGMTMPLPDMQIRLFFLPMEAVAICHHSTASLSLSHSPAAHRTRRRLLSEHPLPAVIQSSDMEAFFQPAYRSQRIWLYTGVGRGIPAACTSFHLSTRRFPCSEMGFC